MSEAPHDARPPRGYPRDSFRLTFRFTTDGVELVSQEHLEMITPPSVGRLPEAGKSSGTWVELLDAGEQRVGGQVLHDPFRTRVDHHSPDGHIEHHEREVTEGEFDVLVPAVRGATAVALVSSELAGARTGRGAVEVARADLRWREW